VNLVNSDNILADACGRAAVRPHAAVRRVKNGPQPCSISVFSFAAVLFASLGRSTNALNYSMKSRKRSA
jgi:hypothetical protein